MGKTEETVDIPFKEMNSDGSAPAGAVTHRASFRPTWVDPAAEHKLGLWLGVYIPTVLNCMGVVFFLRWGFIVGQYGIYLSYGMLAISEICVLFTILSISALVTNGRVRGGGAYCTGFLIVHLYSLMM